MATAFLIPGYNQSRIFSEPAFDTLKNSMLSHGIHLRGVEEGWGDFGVNAYGHLASEQVRNGSFDGVLIGHSLGAIAALSAIEYMPVQHLVLCSPSALFAEDFDGGSDQSVVQLLGQERVCELSRFSAKSAAMTVNRACIQTSLLFGEEELVLHPRLVTRTHQLAKDINGAKLISIPGAAHSIRHNPYASEVARIVSRLP